jgi:PmbA protein
LNGCCYDTAFPIFDRQNFSMNSISTSESRFSHAPETLREIASNLIDYAKKQGATASAAEVSDGFGQAVSVRHGKVETIEYNRDKGLSVTVYIGQQRGNASTSDFSASGATVDAALITARHTAMTCARVCR